MGTWFFSHCRPSSRSKGKLTLGICTAGVIKSPTAAEPPRSKPEPPAAAFKYALFEEKVGRSDHGPAWLLL